MMALSSSCSDEPFAMVFSEPEPGQISAGQSLDVVQVFLNAAIACIAYQRELIPWVSQCFQTRYVDQLVTTNTDTSDIYTSVCGHCNQSDDGSQEFRIFQRGSNARADLILDMLEIGIRDAIIHNYMKAFQVFVTLNEGDPAAVLESYTFTLVYDQSGISQVRISPHVGGNFLVKEVRKSFATAVKSLLRTLKDLPRLPRRRSLGISVIYNEECPASYQPAGFVDAKEHRHVPGHASWATLWSGMRSPQLEFLAGGYIVGVASQSLNLTARPSWTQVQDSNVSVQLQRMQRTSSHNVDVTSTISGPRASQFNRVASAPVLRQPRAVSQLQMGKKLCREENTNSYTSKRAKRSTQSHVLVTSIKKPKLDNGMRSLTVRAKNRRRRNVVPSKCAELIIQARALENEHSGEQPLFDIGQLKQGTIRRLQQCPNVRCECRSTHETDDMLFCQLCGNWQHKKCYGYIDLRPGGLPEEHFCYNCLLLPREDEVNNNMPGLVQMRLAIMCLAQFDTATIELNETLLHSVFPNRSSPSTEFTNLLARLCHEGYIRNEGNGRAIIIGGEDKIEEAQASYLDPLAGITHHYEVVRDGERPEARRDMVKKALNAYIGNRSGSVNDNSNSSYDCFLVKDNAGKRNVRWGFYATWKRRGDVTTQALQPRTSILDRFVNIDRSTPSEASSINEVLGDAVNEADWATCLEHRHRSNVEGYN